MKNITTILILIIVFLVGTTLLYTFKIKRSNFKLLSQYALLKKQISHLNDNTMMVMGINIDNDICNISNLISDEHCLDSVIDKEDVTLALWVREEHCKPCIESIFELISEYDKKMDGFKLTVFTNFEPRRFLKYFEAQIPASSKIIYISKTHKNISALNISMPVFFIIDELNMKHFFIADNNFPYLSKFYLDKAHQKYFNK